MDNDNTIKVVINMERVGNIWLPCLGGSEYPRVCLVHTIYPDYVSADGDKMYKDGYGHAWVELDYTGKVEYGCSDESLGDILTKAKWPQDAIVDALRHNIGWITINTNITGIARDIYKSKHIASFLDGKTAFQDITPFISHWVTQKEISESETHYRRSVNGIGNHQVFLDYLLSQLDGYTVKVAVSRYSGHDDYQYSAWVKQPALYKNNDPLLNVAGALESVLKHVGYDLFSTVRSLAVSGDVLAVGDFNISANPHASLPAYDVYVSGGDLGQERINFTIQ